MNWKEQFDKQIKGLADLEIRDGKWLVERDEVLDFISTEIIEKLIADIKLPYIYMDNDMEIKELKQQLRKDWL